MKWWDQMPWSSFSECWALNQIFSLSSFTFIKRLFSASLSAIIIRVVSSAYLRLLIFHPAILIPPCASSSPAFHMMYFACKLNKQGDNIQLWYTPFPIWNQSVVPCPVLTAASWPAYRFLRRQIKWSGTLISWSLQCRRPGFNLWVGKIPWRRETLPTLLFWPGEFQGLYSPWGHKEWDTTERLSLSLHFTFKNRPNLNQNYRKSLRVRKN